MANEKRLIDADALLEEIQRTRKAYKKITTFTAHNVIACIKIAPTVDAVEVVRCKDCKHRHSSEYCECRPADGYCNDGETGELE